MDDQELMERTRKNMAAFEQLQAGNKQFQEEYAGLIKEAKDLGLSLDQELPLDSLTREQRSRLRDMELQVEREMNEILAQGQVSGTVPKAGRIMV